MYYVDECKFCMNTKRYRDTQKKKKKKKTILV